MGKRWLREKRKDAFYRLAKKEGYRSRAAYKLKQIDDEYKLLGPGRVVVDLGASPGGWSQVAVERCPRGRVVAIDLAAVEPFDGLEFIRGDFTDPAVMAELERLVGRADTVLSDMSPNISGAYDFDHARSVHLAEQALAFAGRMLRPGGDFLVKVFEGDLFPPFLKQVRTRFEWVKVNHPEASRAQSSEVFVMGKRLVPGSATPATEHSPEQLAGRYELNL